MARGAILYLAAAGPALADPTCSAIEAALLRVSDQPGVHQKTVLGDSSELRLEAFLLTDAMYIRDSDKVPFNKVALDRTSRKAMARMTLVAAPLDECTGPASGLDGATPVQIYRYRQPDMTKPGAFTTTALWVGGDGLPRRLVMSPTSYQTMEYGAFTAPTNVVASPEPGRKPAR